MSTGPLSVSADCREFLVEALPVRVYPGQDALAEDAARMAAAQLRAAIARRRRASMILATGNSQLVFLDHLIAQPGIDWPAIELFHLDEYLGLPAGHPAGFRHYLRERVGKRIQSRAFHFLEGDALEPAAECDRYTALLRAHPIDLCLLGIGDNGHLAFNDPPVADFADSRAVKLVKLDDRSRQQQVDQGHFPALAAVPQFAMTLTIPTICAAEKILCLAPGKHKAAIVRETLVDPVRPACPASILRRQAQAVLFLDEASARLL
jgi:glucosamine-6-phosphate deaminase